MENRFSVTALDDKVRLYQLRYPIYSPNILCSTSIDGEYTVYKYIGEDDTIFEALSVQFDPRVYHAFSVHEDCPGISHIGIVHFLSGLFSGANIPILYVNTYASNLIFFSEDYKERVVSVMKSHPRILFD
jgi:hypothetical protein